MCLLCLMISWYPLSKEARYTSKKLTNIWRHPVDLYFQVIMMVPAQAWKEENLSWILPDWGRREEKETHTGTNLLMPVGQCPWGEFRNQHYCPCMSVPLARAYVAITNCPIIWISYYCYLPQWKWHMLALLWFGVSEIEWLDGAAFCPGEESVSCPPLASVDLISCLFLPCPAASSLLPLSHRYHFY